MAILSPSVASGFVKLTSLPVTIDDNLTLILDLRDADNNSFDTLNMEMFTEFSITVHNSGAEAISNLLVEHSPDAVVWEADPNVEAADYFDGIPAGASRSLENITNVRSFFRIQAQTAGPTTSVYVVIAARAASA